MTAKSTPAAMDKGETGSEIWVVTGVDGDCRGVAHEGAARAGMTTGAWIERAIERHADSPPPAARADDATEDTTSSDETADAEDSEMIDALTAIGTRIDESGDRLAHRGAPDEPAMPAPNRRVDASSAAVEHARALYKIDADPIRFSRSVLWAAAAMSVLACVAAGVLTLTGPVAIDALQGVLSETGPASSASRHRNAALPMAPAVVSRDRQIAAALTPRTRDVRSASASDLIAGLRDAAAAGDARAQHSLGLLYATAEASTRDRRRAPIWLHRSAAQGLADAAYHLGVIYEQGSGVVKDRQKSVRFYRRAAKSNHVLAQHNLAVALARTLDAAAATEAAGLMRKAADAGLPESQFSLGILHELGLGVTRDPAVAATWYRYAASHGHTRARARLNRVAAGDRPSTGDIAGILKPFGFDPAAVARVAAITGGQRERPAARKTAKADGNAPGDGDSYLMLLGGSLGKIEFNAPAAAADDPPTRPDPR